MAALVEFSGGVSMIFLFALGLTAVFGILLHEVTHVVAFTVLTAKLPAVTVGIEHLGIAVTPPGTPARWKVAVSSLAPTITAFIAGWQAISVVESWPINWRYAAVIGVLILTVMPSPGDIYTTLLYHPDAAESEVAANG